MSVEKFIIGDKKISFTTIPNVVLQNLRDYAALGLYGYIVSLPPNFIFYKENLASHGNIGRDKINSLLKKLEEHNLITMSQVRSKEGRFSHFSITVHDGTNFKHTDPFTEKPLTENQLLVNRSYKRNIEKGNINKKERDYIYCATYVARDMDNSFSDIHDDFEHPVTTITSPGTEGGQQRDYHNNHG